MYLKQNPNQKKSGKKLTKNNYLKKINNIAIIPSDQCTENINTTKLTSTTSKNINSKNPKIDSIYKKGWLSPYKLTITDKTL